MNINYITVSEINGYVKRILESDLKTQNLTIKGEITNLSISNGNYYFSLKDENASIRAVIFSYYKNRMNYDPKNGDEVYVFGSINVYPKNGSFQIIVQDIMVNGDGAYLLKIEELRKKLEKEGLFASEHKKTLPKYPRTIGVITAKTGAAIHDITRNIIHRYPLADIKYYDSSVQGKNAVNTLINSLSIAIKDNVDVIIIGRGGGDKEDLAAFNEESLVRAVYASPIPIISAVGHESDTTLIDYVSDFRAATPTEAAVVATPDIRDLFQNIDSMLQKVEITTKGYLDKQKSLVDSYTRLIVAKSPLNYLMSQLQSVLMIKEKMAKTMNYKFQMYNNNLMNYNRIINLNISYLLDKYSNELFTLSHRLDLLNPMNIINRGYSLSYKSDGTIIQDVNQIKEEEIMKTIVKNGTIISKVMRKDDNNE